MRPLRPSLSHRHARTCPDSFRVSGQPCGRPSSNWLGPGASRDIPGRKRDSVVQVIYAGFAGIKWDQVGFCGTKGGWSGTEIARKRDSARQEVTVRVGVSRTPELPAPEGSRARKGSRARITVPHSRPSCQPWPARSHTSWRDPGAGAAPCAPHHGAVSRAGRGPAQPSPAPTDTARRPPRAHTLQRHARTESSPHRSASWRRRWVGVAPVMAAE